MNKVFSAVLCICSLTKAVLAQQDSTWEFPLPTAKFIDRPTITLLYGPGKARLSGLNGAFAGAGLAETRLGFSREGLKKRLLEVLERRFTYISIGRAAPGLSKSPRPGELDADVWRFGIGTDHGYGYAIGPTSLFPFHSIGVTWATVTLRTDVKDSLDAIELSMYDSSIRFGTKTEGGIMFFVAPSVGVHASFERLLILPRHLFWKWAGSTLLEGMGHALIDRFVDQILESSPGTVPVVSFLLKNSLSFGLYELRRERMNWPFESSPPILSDSFKFGVTVVF